jgi:hypothetical protein
VTAALLTLPKLDLGRRLTRGLALAELTPAVAEMRESWQADGVLHGELIVDLRDWADPVAALQAIDAGMQTLDAAAPWSYALLVAIDAPWLELRQVVEDAEVTTVRGVLATDTADLQALPAMWQQLQQDGWRRLVAAETGPRLKQAFALGFDRLVGGVGLTRETELVTHLRAHRLPVMLSPSAQIAEKTVASWAQHPLRQLTDAGVTTVLGSGWPQPVVKTLSTELEAVSRHHHWKLEQLRTLMTRNAEAAAIAPEARFGIARQIESWRHRPHAVPAAKGDGWTL